SSLVQAPSGPVAEPGRRSQTVLARSVPCDFLSKRQRPGGIVLDRTAKERASALTLRGAVLPGRFRLGLNIGQGLLEGQSTRRSVHGDIQQGREAIGFKVR